MQAALAHAPPRRHVRVPFGACAVKRRVVSPIRAAQGGDFAPLAQLQNALDTPFDEPLAHPHFTALPPDWAQGIEISCSS